MTNLTKEIKEKLDIVELVQSYIKLEKAGANYKARCPFHNEKTPSFFVSPKRGSYYCFGCGAKGDIFSFVEQFENVDFMGALRLLAEKTGVKIKFEPKAKKDEQERLFDCMEATTEFFEKNLQKNAEAIEYLKKRGLTDSTIKNWRLGFALNDWHTLENELTNRNFTKKEMLACGLIKTGESGKIYDTFRSRIMFPIFDNVKRVIAFSGRIFGDENETAKYLNSPETELFKKSETLYGFHLAKNEIRRLGFSILVEGQMDLLMCHQAGWGNAVATSGTALTNSHLSALKRLSPNIIIAYDNDKAGIKASEKAFIMALQEDFNVKAVKIEDKDPADLIAKDPETWKKSIKEARHIVSFLWENLLAKKLSGEKFVSQFRVTIIPFLAAMTSDAERMRLISLHKMTIETGIREEYLIEEIKKNHQLESVLTENNILNGETKQDEDKTTARRIFGILFSMEGKTIKGDSKELQKRIKSAALESYGKLYEKYKPQKDRMIFETETIYGNDVESGEIEELLANLEKDTLKESLIIKMKELQKAETEKDEAKIKILLKECQEITNKLSSIKN